MECFVFFFALHTSIHQYEYIYKCVYSPHIYQYFLFIHSYNDVYYYYLYLWLRYGWFFPLHKFGIIQSNHDRSDLNAMFDGLEAKMIGFCKMDLCIMNLPLWTSQLLWTFTLLLYFLQFRKIIGSFLFW